jgi:hypothetical protein
MQNMSNNEATDIDFDEVDAPSSENATEAFTQQTPVGKQEKIKIGIIGSNTLTKYVQIQFDSPRFLFKVVDLTDNNTIDDLTEWKPNLTFVCVDIPTKKNDLQDDAVLLDIVKKLQANTNGGICLKSTITPETLERVLGCMTRETYENRFIYNPELVDTTNLEEMLNNTSDVIGGSEKAIEQHLAFSGIFSIATKDMAVRCSPFDACFIKLALSGYKAVAQTYFNQLADTCYEYEMTNYAIVKKTVDAYVQKAQPSLSTPTFIRAKIDKDISAKKAKAYGGEYLNEEVRVFAGMTDKLSLLDTCYNIRNKD